MSTEVLIEHAHLAKIQKSWNYNFSFSIKYQIMELCTVPVSSGFNFDFQIPKSANFRAVLIYKSIFFGRPKSVLALFPVLKNKSKTRRKIKKMGVHHDRNTVYLLWNSLSPIEAPLYKIAYGRRFLPLKSFDVARYTILVYGGTAFQTDLTTFP